MNDTLKDQDSGPVGSGGKHGETRDRSMEQSIARGSDSEPSAPTAAIEGASGGPALKCYQPDCDNGRLYTYENQSLPCPDCNAPEVKP